MAVVLGKTILATKPFHLPNYLSFQALCILCWVLVHLHTRTHI